MSKVIAIMDKPKDCQECVFGICKFSCPWWGRYKPNQKGYYCQLQNPENRIVEEFPYDAEVHLSNCPLAEIPKKLEEHPKEYYQFGSIGVAYVQGYNGCLTEILKGGAE